MTTLEVLQKRLQRVEDLNNTLKLTVRRQESEISRLSVRSDLEEGARHARALERRVKELQGRNELLEADVSTANQRVNVFQHETFTLRTLVKLIDHPELADAARAEAERLLLKEELRAVREKLRAEQLQSSAFQLRCVEACDRADALAAQTEELRQSNARLQEYVTQLLGEAGEAAAVSSEADSAPADERLATEAENLMTSLLEERERRAVLEETVESLQVERQLQQQQLLQQQSTASPSPSSSGNSSRMARLQQVIKAENALLTARVSNLTSQNKDLLERVSTLETEALQLRHLTRSQQSPTLPSVAACTEGHAVVP